MATDFPRMIEVEGIDLTADMPLGYDLEDHPVAEPDDGPRRAGADAAVGRHRNRRDGCGRSLTNGGFAIGAFFT